MLLAALAGFAAVFNIANLVPVWKFDGGQVLRQIFPSQLTLAFMSFATLSAFLQSVAWPGCRRISWRSRELSLPY